MITIGYYSVISGFYTKETCQDIISMGVIMNKLHEDLEAGKVPLRGKVCIRAYQDNECIYQWGSL